MSRIDELIRELCPDGVRHVALSEVADYSSTRVDAADLDETTFVGVDNLVAEKGGRVDASYPPNTARLTAYEAGDILLGNIRPYLKKVWRATNEGGCSGDVLAIRIKRETRAEVESEFLYYLLSSDAFFAYNMQHAKGAKMPRGNKAAILNYRIPVPPLEVQREIVRILDKFTQLEAELEAELEARRVQYEHYRRELLSGGEAASGRIIPLGEIFEMRAGTHIKAAEISDEPTEEKPYPCYGGNGLRGYVSSYNYDESVIFVGRQGALCGNVHRAEGKIYATEHAVVVTPKVAVDMSWAFHKLTEMDLNQYKTKSAQPGLAVGRVKQVEAQYVPIVYQRRHGEMLDKLDTLVSDISIGLPAELGARREQYEYYRDRLLTFKELTS
ncbi:restriction endonuclease subunit S [Brachybacterium sp. AOP42-B2-9]|uniref:restriction endonuclease subunit S n=1 Tax=Brachybacterium sp. AOP42-B2-9 TaxID=3457672 RepID=UPI00403341D4